MREYSHHIIHYVFYISIKLNVTLYINAKWFDTSDAFHGGLAVAISMRQQPKDQMSQDLP